MDDLESDAGKAKNVRSGDLSAAPLRTERNDTGDKGSSARPEARSCAPERHDQLETSMASTAASSSWSPEAAVEAVEAASELPAWLPLSRS